MVADFVISASQLIEHERSGYLVYSKEGWKLALEQLIQSPALRNEMSERFRTFIDQNYSPARNAQKFISFLEEIKK